MANDTVITIVGNLGADAELRFTPSGAAVANFLVLSTPRKLDKQTGEWVDEEPLAMRCNIWRQPAENVAETLTRGMRVIVTGRLRQRSFEHDGQKRTVVELEVDEVGPSLRYATAKVNKTSTGDGTSSRSSSSSSRGSSSGRSSGSSHQPADDPWGSAPPANTGPVDDEPPF